MEYAAERVKPNLIRTAPSNSSWILKLSLQQYMGCCEMRSKRFQNTLLKMQNLVAISPHQNPQPQMPLPHKFTNKK